MSAALTQNTTTICYQALEAVGMKTHSDVPEHLPPLSVSFSLQLVARSVVISGSTQQKKTKK